MEDINKTLDEAIRIRDIKAIRNILTTSMVQDPGFNNGVFTERLNRCLNGCLSKTDIFVPLEGDPINNNQDAWTKDYYAAQRTEFRYNFSRERLEHLTRVGGKLYPPPKPVVSPVNEGAKKKYREGTYTPRPGRSSSGGEGGFPKWLIPAGIAAAALVLLWILFA
jgi:hypothetical protein